MSLKLRVLPLEAQLIRSALTSSVGPAIFRHMVRILVAILLMSLSGVEATSETNKVVLPTFAFSYQVAGEYYSGRFALMPKRFPSEELIQSIIDRMIGVSFYSAMPRPTQKSGSSPMSPSTGAKLNRGSVQT
jgi:hypothetical protein